MATTIAQLCPTLAGKLQLRRKYKTNDNGHVKRWWFLIRDAEEVLLELQQMWDCISAQTSWRLEECLIHKDLPLERPEGAVANATPTKSPLSRTSPPTTEQSVHISGADSNNPTSPPLIVSEHDTVESDVNHPLVIDPQGKTPLRI